MKKTLTIVFGLVLPALVVAGILPMKRIVQRATNREKVARLEATWHALKYTPITRTASFTDQVRKEVGSRSEAGDALSETQRGELAKTVAAFLFAYSAKDYDQYRAFRMPQHSDTRSQFNKSKAAWVVGQLGIGKPPIDGIRDTNAALVLASMRPQDLVREYYLKSVTSTNASGKSLYCMDCWTGVAFDAMRIRINKFTNQIPSIAALMWKEHDLTGASYPATIDFAPAPESLQKKNGEITSAYLSCVLQTDTSITNHSVYFHWYWEPDIQRWMPYEFRGAFAARTIGFVF